MNKRPSRQQARRRAADGWWTWGTATGWRGRWATALFLGVGARSGISTDPVRGAARQSARDRADMRAAPPGGRPPSAPWPASGVPTARVGGSPWPWPTPTTRPSPSSRAPARPTRHAWWPTRSAPTTSRCSPTDPTVVPDLDVLLRRRPGGRPRDPHRGFRVDARHHARVGCGHHLRAAGGCATTWACGSRAGIRGDRCAAGADQRRPGQRADDDLEVKPVLTSGPTSAAGRPGAPSPRRRPPSSSRTSPTSRGRSRTASRCDRPGFAHQRGAGGGGYRRDDRHAADRRGARVEVHGHLAKVPVGVRTRCTRWPPRWPCARPAATTWPTQNYVVVASLNTSLATAASQGRRCGEQELRGAGRQRLVGRGPWRPARCPSRSR